ncbi:helix-turn-helix domain-containing protein [Thermanaerosceptrum fracticalcis]|uniref:helix-turn-helix domain-containing protein n=1 Tax=Thermanaerosceptrum fracticalcis TaxID=1712410 RepID=UPI0030841E42
MIYRITLDILECSRQNIYDLIKRGKLRPIKEMAKDRLFLRSEVEARKNTI